MKVRTMLTNRGGYGRSTYSLYLLLGVGFMFCSVFVGELVCVLSPTEHLLGRGTTKETTRDHVQETYAHMGPGRQRGRDAPEAIRQ